MNWIFFAAISPLFFSLGNIFDKIILTKYIKHPKTMFYLANFFSIIYLFLLFFTDLNNIGWYFVIVGIIAGLIHYVASFFYFEAISKEDVSTLVILFQTISVFTLILSAVFLNEKLTFYQILAFVFILLGSILVSFHKFKITKALPYILGTVFSIALNNVLMKILLGGVSLLQGYFLNGIIHLVVIIPFLRDKKGQANFFKDLKMVGKGKFIFLFLPSICGLMGLLTFFKALSMAQASLVSLLGGFGPVFTFIITLLLTIFFPKILKENFSVSETIRKIIAIFILLAGFFLLTI